MTSNPLHSSIRFIAAGLLAAAVACAADGPKFTAGGELMRPDDYREWIFVTAGLGMTYGPAAQQRTSSPMFDNVFVNPSSYRAFMESGKWPDKTIFVLEIRGSASHLSINKDGHFQDDLLAVEAAVKDEQRFPGKWAYFGFPGAPGPLAATAKANPQGQCFSCHVANAAVENTFVQFYPTLLRVAQKKGTVRSSYRVPASPTSFYETLTAQGWPAAHSMLTAERTANTESPLADSRRLLRIAGTLTQNGKKTEAVALLKFVADEQPADPKIWKELAEGFAAAGDNSAAANASNKAMSLSK